MLAGIAVSDCGLSVLEASVSVLQGDLVSLCTPECKYSCKTCSLMVVLGYVALWPHQLWLQTEIERLLSQAVPRLLCPQGFWLFPLRSRHGPTCTVWPLCTPESLANSIHPLDMVSGGRGWATSSTEVGDRNRRASARWFWV